MTEVPKLDRYLSSGPLAQSQGKRATSSRMRSCSYWEIATMSDHETNFEKWITAYNEHERRKSFCHFMRDKYPPDHQFVKEAKANWTKRGPNTNGS